MHGVVFKAVATPRENLLVLGFPARSIKNRVVQTQKTSRGMKYQIMEGKELHYVAYKLHDFLKARFIKMEHECINKTKKIPCAPSEDSDQPWHHA